MRISGFDFDYLANEYGFVVALMVMKTIETTADEAHHIPKYRKHR